MAAKPNPAQPHNVISGKRDDEETVRPSWVPENAVWAGGMWTLNGVNVDRLGLNPNLTRSMPADREAERLEANRVVIAKQTEGLPPGHFRQGGLIWRHTQSGNKIASDLPTGGSDDGSHRPGYTETRAERIERIQETSARHQAAIRAFDAAKLAMEKADAAFHRSYENPEE